jgi:hypothetical protein
VRADRDGIRTFFASGKDKIKFEILLEARIDLTGVMDPELKVLTLSWDSAVAEKFLALTDRGADEATFSRDLIDLAFLAAKSGADSLCQGKMQAEEVYGKAVQAALSAALDLLTRKLSYRKACLAALSIEDAETLDQGLASLKKIRPSVRLRQK